MKLIDKVMLLTVGIFNMYLFSLIIKFDPLYYLIKYIITYEMMGPYLIIQHSIIVLISFLPFVLFFIWFPMAYKRIKYSDYTAYQAFIRIIVPMINIYFIPKLIQEIYRKCETTKGHQEGSFIKYWWILFLPSLLIYTMNNWKYSELSEFITLTGRILLFISNLFFIYIVVLINEKTRKENARQNLQIEI
ncbi:MAG: DUF4328 domain-containing protein [Spirochaetales bacterium]|nr:DUF4328 domain-containing protein [Spirochaetales bacterium]